MAAGDTFKRYGTQGAGDLIAPNTPLVFEIELFATRK